MEILTKCQLRSIDQGSSKGIDRHLIADVFSSHDPDH